MALWTLEGGSSYEGALYYFSLLLVQSYSLVFGHSIVSLC